jgi:hypothetical protein
LPAAQSQKLVKIPGPKEHLIVVEGADDVHAIGHLCRRHGIEYRFRVEEAGGYEALRDSVDSYLDESDLRRIGFVIDANDRPLERWQSIRDVLHSTNCGYSTVPAACPAEGAVIDEPGLRVVVGIWMMPDNASPGALEEFLRGLIPEGDVQWNYACQSVRGIPGLSTDITDNWLNKANVHTWLAWRDDVPGKPIGTAIRSGDFDSQAMPARNFIDWVRRLFDFAP